MKHEIYELYPSARHAYIAIGLAVKTGRPRNVIPAKAGISHFFIKERFSQYGRYQSLASQHFGRAIASIPKAVGKGNLYPSNNKKFAYPAYYSYFGQQLYQNTI